MTGSEGAKDRLRLWLRLLRLTRHVDAHLRDRLQIGRAHVCAIVCGLNSRPPCRVST